VQSGFNGVHVPGSNTQTTPQQRNLRGSDQFHIWFGAAIAISEIWGGGLPSLTAVGLAAGLLAILFGRLIGNGLMAGMAAMGATTGLPTMLLIRPAFGIRGSYLPALFNVLQLLGWTGWMLFVGFLYLDSLAGILGLPVSADVPAMKFVWITLLGALCILWAAGGQRFWQLAQRGSAVLLFLLSISMTWIVISSYGIPRFSMLGVTPLSLLAASDIVIAMSISWLPLVADYSRFSVRVRSSAMGTFWGYFIGGSWMYAVGLLVATSQGITSFGEITPDQLVIQTMGAAGLTWAIIAIVLVLLSTVTTTFLDIYSCVVSTQSLLPQIPDRLGNLLTGLAGILIACFLNVFAFEGFLLAIGAIFLPIFSIVLCRHYFGGLERIDTAEVTRRSGTYWYLAGFNMAALLAWLFGFLVYDWARGFASVTYFLGLAGVVLKAEPLACGASLPCLLASVAAYLILSRMLPGTSAARTAS
jgi:putative hydroxymethylpyrimidine transporter CytX